MAERDTRAMVSAGWWPATPPQQRQNLIAGRMLGLPDGTWWLFGAWARWYRWTPADGQWYLCPPPQLTITRMSARPLRQGMPVPQIPPHIVPTGPDFGYEPPAARTFVEHEIQPEITSRVRATVESAAALPAPDYPHWWGLFSTATPSTVAVTWGVMLWSAAVPVFDSRFDSRLLALWSPYRSRPLPRVDGPRWLTPPPLETLIGLYAERLRAGRVDAAVVILRTMWATAGALRDDDRFRGRAEALLAILDATLHNPTIDYGVLPYGDRALVQQWLARCPPALAPVLRVEASPGEHFRNACYDLAVALTPVAGDPAEPGYLEPRLLAAALLAADLAVVRRDVAAQVIGWLDPEIRHVIGVMLGDPAHPLRRMWPEGNRLPRPLRERLESAGPPVRERLLAAMYTADLAWCRLGGGIPARPRGFPSPVAVLAEIIGVDRATAAAPGEPVTPTPGIAPLSPQYPANPVAADPAPAAPAVLRPPTGPPGQAPAWATPVVTPDPAIPPGAPDAAVVPGAPGASDPGAMPDAPVASDPGVVPDAAVPPATRAWTAGASPEVSIPSPPPAPPSWTGTVHDEDIGDSGHLPTMVDTAGPEPARRATVADVADPGPAHHATMVDAADPPPEGSEGHATMVDAGGSPPGESGPYATMIDASGAAPARPEAPSTMLDPAPAPPEASPAVPDPSGAPPEPGTAGSTHVDPAGGTRVDAGAIPSSGAPHGPPAPPEPEPLETPGAPEPPKAPGTRLLERPGGEPERPRTRVMSQTMVAGLLDAPMPGRPVEEIEPPPSEPRTPQVTERFGIRFVSGADDAADLLDEVRRAAEPAERDAAPRALPPVLIVGAPHRGQRRLTRLIARTLAEAGLGDGSVRTADAAGLPGDRAQAVRAVLRAGGPPLLFERLDAAVLEAPDPAEVAAAVAEACAEPDRAPLIATCAPESYERLAAGFPDLVRACTVFRLPDLDDIESRMALTHVLADERRVTIDASALEAVRTDLRRLGGRGDLVGARLVEGYLDRAVARHTQRAGASRDRLVLTPEDFAGVAEGIEPSLRPPGDVDGFLRALDEMIGLDQVKRTVRGLIDDARTAADRAARGLPTGDPIRHLVFVGRPGTGKATVAGLIGGAYAALNLLDTGHVVACDARGLAGNDPAGRITTSADRATGGVLLVEDAHLLARAPAAATALLRLMDERRGRFLVVCTGPPGEMDAFWAADPGLPAEFGTVVEFAEPTDRQLVQMYSRIAERDLYLLDEELRVELLERFGVMRRSPDFAFAGTVRRLFEQTVARQAARLAAGRARVDAATVARLSVRDLPETQVERLLADLREDRGRR